MPPFTSTPYSGTWHVQYSTRKLWHKKRNVHATFTASDSLDYSYQEHQVSEIKTHQETDWKVVGNGKDGTLESWMTETELGIVDTAGEIRADWRSRWIIVVFPQQPTSFDEVDILCSRRKAITDNTVGDIQGFLKSEKYHLPGSQELVLLAVPDDGARNAEMRMAEEQRLRDWEQRTGENEGISEDLVYDDVDEKENSKCIVQ